MQSIASSIIHFIFGIIGMVLALRFLFRFIGANSDAQIVSWMYTNSAPFVQPFIGILPNLTFGKFVVELSTLLAMLAVLIIGAIVENIVSSLIN